ncbi:FUSC family protein [Pseudarthrobacter phenanthrenivorans]|uniref:FUSC family protein n=1 Tax=Pseudarthrobacter phenanthrenivorans TaxID=361575 RepID=A0A3B0FMG8_PSEPS|nr:FUSC family protein [Pseudarthrobacter phenanthrenivorans]RKO20858.1 FUSC family protein [Pseudarthrobacter phenanthrenivorans]
MERILLQVRALHRLEPANNDHLAAMRVALSVAVPSLLLLAAGRTDLIIYAVFGALTGMYGRSEPHQLRLRHQSQAAVVLLGGVAVGVFLSVNHLHSWWLVGVEAVLAAVGSVFADRVRLRPNGPFFGILALGACASVPTVVPWHAAMLIAAGSAAFSMLVGFGGWIRSRSWQRGASRGLPATLGAGGREQLVHAVRYMAAVGAAGGIGVLSGSGHPHWAMAAAAVPLAGADLPSSVRRGIHRIVGTFVGLVVTAAVILPVPWSLAGLFPGRQAVVLALLVIVFQFTTELFMTRHYGLAMVSFTPVILLMTQLAHPSDPGVLILERAVETLVGALVGILVVVAVRRAGTRSTAALLGVGPLLTLSSLRRFPGRSRH